MNQDNLKKYLPWIACAFAAIYFAYCAMPQRGRADDFNYRDFGRFPVLDDGRYKPMDTVARSSLMIITHRQSYYDADTGKRYPATKWILDVMTSPPARDGFMSRLCPNGSQHRPAWDHKIFRIENDELVRELGLPWRDGLRYSIGEFSHKMAFLEDQERRIRKKDVKHRSLFDAKLMELNQHLQMCMAFSSHMAPGVVPEANGGGEWKSFRAALAEWFGPNGNHEDPNVEETVRTYMALLSAYDAGEPAKFNDTLSKYLGKLEARSPGLMRAMSLEVSFNEASPFYHCLEVYVLIALIGAFSWVATSWSQPARHAAYATMGLVFVVHTLAIVMRIYLQGKPPVTNLYSSAIFIGWGCVGVCMIVEWFHKNAIAIVVGAVTGFCTLIIAHLLSLDGDTMPMMQAVLDTNFWLATHVTCVTLGYTAAFVAGFMGIAYIFLGIFTDMLRKEGSANLTRMTYGVLCAGMFLSFVGTVLGGLWADYSWGRFWGWDPKENGALLIVLWIALILHARWGGMVKHRGIAVLSVIGIIITSWSWFGTNFLGVGLHAYGGAKANAMLTLILIDIGFLAIAGLGLLPLQHWQSFRPLSSQTKPAAATASAAARPETAKV